MAPAKRLQLMAALANPTCCPACCRPGAAGLWMWSQPLRRTALDGSNYYLVRACLACGR